MGFESLRQLVEVTYTTQDVFNGVGFVAAAAGILCGGVLVWYLFIWGLKYWWLPEERTAGWVLFNHDPKKKENWFGARPSRTCGNIKHVFLQTVLFAGIGIIVWFACGAAGFNPLTTGFATLGVSILGTYSMMRPLQQMGSGYALITSNEIAVGEHWEFYGMGSDWAGIIRRIGTYGVEMERFDPGTQSGELLWFPIDDFLGRARKRNWSKEFTAKALTRDHMAQYAHKVTDGVTQALATVGHAIRRRFAQPVAGEDGLETVV